MSVLLRHALVVGLIWRVGLRLWAGGDEVVVVFNTEGGPDSRLVAEHYAERRQVPTNQIIGLNLPQGESLTRAQFSTRLQQPLVDALEDRGLIAFHGEIVPASENRPGRVLRLPIAARVRYVALCYGVPSRILEDAKPTGTNKTVLPTQRREAAVDSELALLPFLDQNLPIESAVPNRFSGTQTFSQLHPTNGLLMVTRLDGPSGSLARDLVDKALSAETNGLWGRAFFDARGLKDGNYKLGDDWIVAAANAARRQGVETVLDERAATFGPGFPLPQVALYAGWYDQAPSGPFKHSTVEFMPGAIAYHLFSFSARSIRATNTWVGCLLDNGAAATVGFVNEPYLTATIDVGVWFSRLLEEGATFGEAVYAALPCFSWQTTVIGDPLYRPFARFKDPTAPKEGALAPSLAPWARLRQANLRLARGDSPGQVAEELARAPETAASALLEEKIGDLHEAAGKLARSVEAYRRALALKPTSQQRVRLQLGLARLLTALRQPKEAIAAYDEFFHRNPRYPDLLRGYQQALVLAKELKDESLTRRYQAEIDYLSPPPAATNPVPAKPR